MHTTARDMKGYIISNSATETRRTDISMISFD